jgi:excisionase family DNA binding protein
MDSHSKDIMAVLELCEYLQMSEAKIREMLRQGTLPAVLIGRQWRIRKSAIDRWMAEQEGRQLHDIRRRRAMEALARKMGPPDPQPSGVDDRLEAAVHWTGGEDSGGGRLTRAPKEPAKSRDVETALSKTRKRPR